jgi:predicted nucleic acid-binding protein
LLVGISLADEGYAPARASVKLQAGFDAHLWAYAEHFGLREIISDDFEDGRMYGSVRITNPFRRSGH